MFRLPKNVGRFLGCVAGLLGHFAAQDFAGKLWIFVLNFSTLCRSLGDWDFWAGSGRALWRASLLFEGKCSDRLTGGELHGNL